MAAIERKMHVMVTKPMVKKLDEHWQLVKAAHKNKVLCCQEYHKRFDPIYADAVNKMRNLGDCGHFQSFMSQPKFQLQTFKRFCPALITELPPAKRLFW